MKPGYLYMIVGNNHHDQHHFLYGSLVVLKYDYNEEFNRYYCEGGEDYQSWWVNPDDVVEIGEI